MSPAGVMLPPRRNRFRRETTGARNVVASYVGAGAEGFVFLVLTPFLARRLGLGGLGLWGLAVAIADWLPLLDFGIRDALLKYMAAHQAREDLSAARRTVEAVLFVYTMLAALALTTVAVVAWVAIPMVVEDAEKAGLLTNVFLIVGISGAISLPASAGASLLEGLSRFDLLNLIRIGHQILRLVLVVLALQLGFGVIGVAVAEVAARMVLHVVRWISIARIRPELIVAPRPHFDELGRLFGLGVWNALRQVAEVASLRLYEPILAAFAGLPSVGAFWAGRRFATIPAEAVVPMAGVLFPLSSEMEAEGRDDDLRRTLLEMTKLALLLAVPLALLIGIGAPMIQTNWLSGKAPEAEPVMAIFSAVFVATAASLPSEAVLLGLGRSRFVGLCLIVQVAILIGVGVPATERFGAAGLATAALAATVVAQVAIQMPVAARACGIPIVAWWREVFAPVAKAAIPVGVVMLVLRNHLAVGGLAGLAAWGGGAVVTYAILCWTFGLNAAEKAYLQDHAARILEGGSRNGTGS